jgi:hypothetical protein
MKKLFMTAIMVMMLGVLAGCGGNSSSSAKSSASNDTTEAKKEAAVDDSAPDTGVEGAYVLFNGVELKAGGKFSAVKDKLGEVAKPDETIEPCDGGTAGTRIMHYYTGITITEYVDDDTMEFIEVNSRDVGEGDAALGGTVKLGGTADEVTALLGDTTDKDDTYLGYNFNDVMIQASLNDGKVENISLAYYNHE